MGCSPDRRRAGLVGAVGAREAVPDHPDQRRADVLLLQRRPGGRPARLARRAGRDVHRAGDHNAQGPRLRRQHPARRANQEVVLDSWSRGPVLLIGDAAHATSPNMAQGAAMALEDAVVLASSLATAGSIAEALRGYEARRRPRTNWVLTQTHRRDKATGLPPALPDLVMRRLGEQMFRSNYGPLFVQP
ncbi:FAD-dependent monooxygenase [Micromonospora sp. STR1s_5]|nr:FAD-dependent monooxygenase [Micromonospora sp. STR1s_5]